MVLIHAHRVGIKYKKPTLGRRRINVCFREKSGHRILSASSPFMTPFRTSVTTKTYLLDGRPHLFPRAHLS